MRRSRMVANKDGLYPKEVAVVNAFCDPNSPSYMNKSGSVLVGTPDKYKNKFTRSARAREIFTKPSVIKCIRARLNTPDIDEMLESGVRVRLADPNKKGWQETADFVAKLRGDFAPERHLNMEMTQEDRDQVYAEIMDKIRHAQQPAVK